jgi:two-component system response regulator YesN
MLKRWASDSHAQQIVQEMMAYVQQHYLRPMSLGDVAAALKINAAYLSGLFSATAGVTFHKHLEGVRLSKARELLRNPHNRVCEVACAVGYGSANQFRHAFKASAGVPPSAWRWARRWPAPASPKAGPPAASPSVAAF